MTYYCLVGGDVLHIQPTSPNDNDVAFRKSKLAERLCCYAYSGSDHWVPFLVHAAIPELEKWLDERSHWDRQIPSQQIKVSVKLTRAENAQKTHASLWIAEARASRLICGESGSVDEAMGDIRIALIVADASTVVLLNWTSQKIPMYFSPYVIDLLSDIAEQWPATWEGLFEDKNIKEQPNNDILLRNGDNAQGEVLQEGNNEHTSTNKKPSLRPECVRWRTEVTGYLKSLPSDQAPTLQGLADHLFLTHDTVRERSSKHKQCCFDWQVIKRQRSLSDE